MTKISMDKEYRTRGDWKEGENGKDVTIDRVNGPYPNMPVEGRFVGSSVKINWSENGRWAPGRDGLLDLIEVSEVPEAKVGASLLKPAIQIDATLDILGERETTHGSYPETARMAQRIKKEMRAHMAWNAMSAQQCQSLEMIATKIARIICGDANEPDHWKDIEGYARLVSRGME